MNLRRPTDAYSRLLTSRKDGTVRRYASAGHAANALRRMGGGRWHILSREIDGREVAVAATESPQKPARGAGRPKGGVAEVDKYALTGERLERRPFDYLQTSCVLLLADVAKDFCGPNKRAAHAHFAKLMRAAICAENREQEVIMRFEERNRLDAANELSPGEPDAPAA